MSCALITQPICPAWLLSWPKDFSKFEKLIDQHEDLVSSALHLQKVKDLHFKDYWGSEIQIKNEIEIINELDKIVNLDNEMKYNETIIEWYERMLMLTKKLI
mgnify:CR=1 FL=1